MTPIYPTVHARYDTGMTEIAEFDRWMSLERIARSEFASLLFDAVKSGAWSDDDAMNLSVAALQGFGNGCCYFLASAVATVTGYPIAGFLRPGGSLIHAAVVDPGTMTAFDILGRRPISDLRTEMRSVAKDARLVTLPHIVEMDRAERDLLIDIAMGLPWMPVQRSSLPLDQWARLLIGYVRVRLTAQPWPHEGRA